MKRGLHKCNNTKIYLSYENDYLVMTVTEEEQISAIDNLKCSAKIANIILNMICNNFINDHMISFVTINNDNGKKQLHIHNTYIEIVRSLNNLEDLNIANKLIKKTYNKIKSKNNFTKLAITNERNINSFQQLAVIFFNHYLLTLKRLSNKDDFFNIYPYYTEGNLIIQIVSAKDNQTVVYDSLECNETQAQSIIYLICQSFTNNHKIISSSLKKINNPIDGKLFNQKGNLKMQNTKFNLDILFDDFQENNMRRIYEETLKKSQNLSKRISFKKNY